MTKASRQRISEAMKERWAMKKATASSVHPPGGLDNSAVALLEEGQTILSEAMKRSEELITLEIPLQDAWILEDIVSKEVGRQASFASAQEDISKVSHLLSLKLRLHSETKRAVASR